jgi:hypothetical protein
LKKVKAGSLFLWIPCTTNPKGVLPLRHYVIVLKWENRQNPGSALHGGVGAAKFFAQVAED